MSVHQHLARLRQVAGGQSRSEPPGALLASALTAAQSPPLDDEVRTEADNDLG
jgi:hypothetical protein